MIFIGIKLHPKYVQNKKKKVLIWTEIWFLSIYVNSKVLHVDSQNIKFAQKLAMFL